jgi:hypothetical protein
MRGRQLHLPTLLLQHQILLWVCCIVCCLLQEGALIRINTCSCWAI